MTDEKVLDLVKALEDSLARAATCPNCDHLTHHGARCAGRCDDGAPCACSWPDPHNFATTSTVHCEECHEPEHDPDMPFRRIRIGGRPRYVCSWCDHRARAEAEAEERE